MCLLTYLPLCHATNHIELSHWRTDKQTIPPTDTTENNITFTTVLLHRGKDGFLGSVFISNVIIVQHGIVVLLCVCMYLRQAELEELDSDNDGRSSLPTRTQGNMRNASSGMTVLATLQDRLEMYQQARSIALTSGDSSKARRLDRGLNVSWLFCDRTSLM